MSATMDELYESLARERKAAKLAITMLKSSLKLKGVTAPMLAATISKPGGDMRVALLHDAKVEQASEATWARVVELLNT